MKEGTTNKEFSESDTQFLQACINAKIKPTTRQASKWRMKKGKAWKIRKEAP